MTPKYEPPTLTYLGQVDEVGPQLGRPMTAGVCRLCGCTEADACVIDGLGRLVDVFDGQTLPEGWTVCSWVEPDLCSNCVESPAPPPLLYDGNGRPLRGAP